MSFRATKIKKHNSYKNVQMKHKTYIRLTRMYQWNKLYIKTTMISMHKHVHAVNE